MDKYVHLLGNGQSLNDAGIVNGTVNTALMQSGSPIKAFYQVAGTVSAMLGFYHGFKRHNKSYMWGLWWFVTSGLFWPITMPLAAAQGFGKSKSIVKGLAGWRELQQKFRSMRK